ncbi:MAG TPA: class I SAM-dependent methyltransferase [Longimicrobiales bacterium]|nr:class I SAM-dependent methyltransferase [Longimicrobiales bacterium]
MTAADEAPPVTAPWWRHHFDETYLRLHGPRFDEAENRAEVAAVLDLLGLPLGSRVLDLPCGWGRHTRLFGEAGQDAFGADLSPVFLARARQGSRAHGLTPRYAAADMRALPFRDASFDAVVNLDSSLGLFLADAEDVRALAEARRVLRPGGRFLLETMHRDDVVANFASRDAWTLPDGTEVRVRRRFDPVQGISHESLRWQHGRQKGRTRSAFRVRTATELDGLLRAAGLRPLLWRGGWDGSPFRRRSERLIVVAGLD